jgi:hypothetical protein
MTVPTFVDWAKMLEGCKIWRPYQRIYRATTGKSPISSSYRIHRIRENNDEGFDRHYAVRNYILSRIQRKEEAWANQIKMTMPTFHSPIVRFSDDGFPYPPDSQSALTEINLKEE